jgi:hypothetical protein
MENKLIKTGQWYWRIGEISLKDYYTLSSASRRQHIEFLLTLEQSQRSTTDNIILLVSRTKEEKENSKFLEL